MGEGYHTLGRDPREQPEFFCTEHPTAESMRICPACLEEEDSAIAHRCMEERDTLAREHADCIRFLRRVAYEPVGPPESTNYEVLQTLTEEARRLLQRIGDRESKEAT